MGSQLTVASKGDLQNVESNMMILKPRFDALLHGGSINSDTLIQGLLVQCERNNRLMKCSLSSLVTSMLSFAALRLPVDGATGQAFILPFKGVAQPCIGYKGYNTIAARSGVTISAGTVREGDVFEWEKGTNAFVRHIPKLDSKAPITAFWSTATSNLQPSIVEVLGIGHVKEVMERSPAVRAGADTPWKDPIIGFPAMGEKTVRRRLSRSIPYSVDDGRFLMAARMEEAFEEQGKRSWIENGAVLIEGDGGKVEAAPQPDAGTLMSPRQGEHEKALREQGRQAAAKGTASLRSWFVGLPNADKRAIETFKDSDLKKIAEDRDRADIARFDAGDGAI